MQDIRFIKRMGEFRDLVQFRVLHREAIDLGINTGIEFNKLKWRIHSKLKIN